MDRRIGTWRKSSKSGNAQGNCVLLRATGSGGVQIGDSKLGADTPTLGVDVNEHGGFITLVKSGQFDH
ncbi:DUF397 domain-containing protein [Phytomonospora sp. NPDC050363]|uniref:DUF397 domain-containing protein n=1 Tax=Phytomonospora sp. NPDC050363 TaxID=3155642 RepID=UPI00340E368A